MVDHAIHTRLRKREAVARIGAEKRSELVNLLSE
jgi:hypothetical protein